MYPRQKFLPFPCDFFPVHASSCIDAQNFYRSHGMNNDDLVTKQQRFCALLEPNHDRLARFARAMTKSHEDARDLVSDTIEQAYKHFDTLQSEAAFLSWLFTIARRIENRRRWRMSIFDRFHAEDYEDVHDDYTSNASETYVDTQILYDALQRLPHKQREAFVLFEISGFSLQEIQEMQGDSLSAVKMRLVRARDALRNLLGGNVPSGASGAGEAQSASTNTSARKATIHHLKNPQEQPQSSSQQANIRSIRRST